MTSPINLPSDDYGNRPLSNGRKPPATATRALRVLEDRTTRTSLNDVGIVKCAIRVSIRLFPFLSIAASVIVNFRERASARNTRERGVA